RQDTVCTQSLPASEQIRLSAREMSSRQLTSSLDLLPSAIGHRSTLLPADAFDPLFIKTAQCRFCRQFSHAILVLTAQQQRIGVSRTRGLLDRFHGKFVV